MALDLGIMLFFDRGSFIRLATDSTFNLMQFPFPPQNVFHKLIESARENVQEGDTEMKECNIGRGSKKQTSMFGVRYLKSWRP